MKRYFVLIILLILCGTVTVSCKKEEEEKDVKLFNKEYSVGKDITSPDISEFYYTYSNINYDAFYQRYRFYAEAGSRYFFYETRERKNDYGPATEEDTTAKGTVMLTNEQWAKFFELISGGTVREREDSAESGDSGPWYFLYWERDKEKYREYTFASVSAEKAFEDYCEAFAADPLPLSAEEYPPIDETLCGNWKGGFKNVSGEYYLELGAPADGKYPVNLRLAWNYSDSAGGMYTDLIDVEGSAILGDKGVTIVEGTLDDGSSEKDKKFRAVIGKINDKITMVVIEAEDSSRLVTGLRLDFSRE